MKTRLLILIAVGMIGFIGTAFAEHDPNQPYIHSIILPDDVKEKTFDEFMEWCESCYEDKCVELYADIHLIPEPEPPYFENIDEEKPCGLGTIYQDGICVVDKIENSAEISADPSKRWGGPYTFDGKPPLKQFKSGVPVDEIQCNESLIRMVKHDGSPACVTQSTAPKLSDRGWSWALDLELWEENHLLIPPSNYEIQNDDGNYGSQYMISGARVDDISYDESHNSLVILLSSPERGILQIMMPSGLLHSVTSPPFSYVVLANGIEIEYEKLSPIMLKIPFDSGTEQLEIVGFD